MGIIVDGERSRKLTWFAKKLIRKLRMLNMSTTMLRYNGFLLKAWKRDDLSGGRITAPMGAVVIHTSLNGVSVMTADSWKGGFDGRKYFSILFKNISSGLIINFLDRVPAEDLEAAGFFTFLNLPLATESPYYMDVDGSTTPETEWHEDAMPTPVVIPMLAGEAFWSNLSGVLFIDENDDGIPDTLYHSAQESSLTFYSSDGSNLSGRRTLAIESAGSIPSVAARTIALMPSVELSAVIFQYVFYPDIGSGRYAALAYTGSKDGFAHGYFTLSNIISNMPTGLQSAIESPGEGLVSSVDPGGNYAFSTGVDIMATLFHVVDLTNTRPGPTADSSEDDWFDSNPTEEKWRISFHFQKFGGTVYSVNSDNFMSLLDHMASGSSSSPSSDWEDAMYVFMQLLPRPNHNFHVPYDSVMFHAEDANIYVWTRKYNSATLGNFGGSSFNAFKFSRTGLSVTTIQIPSVVTGNEGVRPTITYAGDGIYLCVCEYIDTPLRVHEIHIGSPFTSWTEIPKPDGTDNLIHVRPVRVKAGDVILLGIIEDDGGLYYLAFLEYKESIGSWKRLGQIPAIRPTEYPSGSPYPYIDNSNWSVALFGEGEFAKEMSQYLSPPYALPQMPIGPYGGYTGGMP